MCFRTTSTTTSGHPLITMSTKCWHLIVNRSLSSDRTINTSSNLLREEILKLLSSRLSTTSICWLLCQKRTERLSRLSLRALKCLSTRLIWWRIWLTSNGRRMLSGNIELVPDSIWSTYFHFGLTSLTSSWDLPFTTIRVQEWTQSQTNIFFMLFSPDFCTQFTMIWSNFTKPAGATSQTVGTISTWSTSDLATTTCIYNGPQVLGNYFPKLYLST